MTSSIERTDAFLAVIFVNGERVGDTVVQVPMRDGIVLSAASRVTVAFARQHPTIEQSRERPLFLSGLVETS